MMQVYFWFNLNVSSSRKLFFAKCFSFPKTVDYTKRIENFQKIGNITDARESMNLRTLIFLSRETIGEKNDYIYNSTTLYRLYVYTYNSLYICLSTFTALSW